MTWPLCLLCHFSLQFQFQCLLSHFSLMMTMDMMTAMKLKEGEVIMKTEHVVNNTKAHTYTN